ncbi:hypothetical protein B9T19_02735 [Ignatzschineria sp. F8392]|uniref:SGNH/GDSL hydrolase family protein n=1 Tax=Ignatzschineria sp. F8392 TaxID=1980117 RepID=UPI000B980341|nr:hypothetical protein [Ignatzschineria sp. F8392]OYQ81601.1 hypothetical protein B9T19_02735 [Ignatzschineria sp. F8392]
MNLLTCYLKFDKEKGFSFGFTGLDVNVPCSFYLLRDGKKYFITGYSELKTGLYSKNISPGTYQVIAFARVHEESLPIIIKSNIITLDSSLKIKNSSENGNKRTIRLKEWGVNINRLLIPNDAYLKNRPSLIKKSYQLTTTKNGFITNTKLNDSLDDDCESILFLGASQIECLYVDEGKRITDQFQIAINSNNGENYKVLNGGYSGTTSLQILNIILNKAVEEKPKRIYCCLPTNDLYAFNNGGYWNNTPRFSAIIPSDKVSSKKPLEKHQWYSELRKIYSLIINFVDLIDAEICFMTFAHIDDYDYSYNKNTYNKDVFSNLSNDRKVLNSIFREVILDLGGELIDIEQYIDFDHRYFYDDVHFNEDGCNFVANILITKTILGS